MAFEIGERVTSTWTGPATIIGPLERDEDNIPYQRIRQDKAILGPVERLYPVAKMQSLATPPPQYTPKTIKPRAHRSLKIKTLTTDLASFVNYLRTPEANTRLYLEAQDQTMDGPIRDQYRRLTNGEELILGAGYHVAPESAKKQGCEGSVTFIPPAQMPDEVLRMMPQRHGLINHIDFVWLLVEQGFRVTRAK